MSRVDVDIATDRYRAVLLGKCPDDWPDGLRFPLLQRAVAEELQRNEDAVEVGIQAVSGDDLQVLTFGTRDIDEAVSAGRELAQEVARLMGLPNM